MGISDLRQRAAGHSRRKVICFDDGKVGDRPFAAIVLAGSHGWGGAHIPGLPPRPLVRIALRPLISYPLEWACAGGAASLTICANGSAVALRDALGDRCHDLELAYKEDHMPRGPAGCIRDAALEVDGNPLVVAEATVAPRLDIARLLKEHRNSGAAMTVVTSVGTDFHVSRPAGIYVIDRRVLERIPSKGYQDLKENVIPALHAAGERILSYASPEPCRRVAGLDSYMALNFWLVERMAITGELPADDIRWLVASSVAAQPGAAIHRDALCIGPVLVGGRTRIPSGATIVGPTVIGQDVAIEPGALVSRSVVGNSCHIGAGAVVHGCILADHSEARSGSNLCYALKLRRRVTRSWLRDAFAGRPQPQIGRRPAAYPGVAASSVNGRIASIATRRAAS